jgi:hypothetical protein
MGNSNVSENDLKWGDQELQKVEEFLSTQNNPKTVHFQDFKFPGCEEDPVEMIVKDFDDKTTEYRLKSYRYPPFHDIKDC